MFAEHERKDGWRDAFVELNKRAQADLDAKRGEIKPARVKFAYYASAKLQIVKRLLRKVS